MPSKKRSAEETTPQIPKKKMKSFDVDSFIKVVVGQHPNQKSFLVHEETVCERSEFFRQAMNGNWAQSSDRIVEFPSDSVDIFEMYLNLLYTRKIPKQRAVPWRLATPYQFREQIDNLIELYILAEKLQDISAEDEVIKIITVAFGGCHRAVFCFIFDCDTIRYIYENTPQNSKLRGFAAGSSAKYTTTSYLTCNADNWPHDFLLDLAVVAMRNMMGR